MLKPLLILLLLGSVGGVRLTQAQTLPNGGLENWETRKSQEAPATWLTLDDFGTTLGFSIPGGSVTKVTDSHSGSFAAKLTSLTIANPVGDTNISGELALGTKIGSVLDEPGGLPITGKPSQVQFYYKLSGTGLAADPAEVEVTLTKTVAGKRQTVGEGSLELTSPVASYTVGTVSVTYSAAIQPDSVHLYFSTGNSVNVAFWVDDVSLLGLPTPTRAAQENVALNIYPNPSTHGVFTFTAPQAEVLTAAVLITDAVGHTVLRQAAQPTAQTRTLDLQQQPAGLYFLHVQLASGTLTRRLLIH